MDSDLILPVVAVGLVVALVGGVAYLAIEDGKEWQAFAQAHECVVVGKTQGHNNTGYAVGANGKGGIVTTYTPGQTGYACNDGITYWR